MPADEELKKPDEGKETSTLDNAAQAAAAQKAFTERENVEALDKDQVLTVLKIAREQNRLWPAFVVKELSLTRDQAMDLFNKMAEAGLLRKIGGAQFKITDAGRDFVETQSPASPQPPAARAEATQTPAQPVLEPKLADEAAPEPNVEKAVKEKKKSAKRAAERKPAAERSKKPKKIIPVETPPEVATSTPEPVAITSEPAVIASTPERTPVAPTPAPTEAPRKILDKIGLEKVRHFGKAMDVARSRIFDILEKRSRTDQDPFAIHGGLTDMLASVDMMLDQGLPITNETKEMLAKLTEMNDHEASPIDLMGFRNLISKFTANIEFDFQTYAASLDAKPEVAPAPAALTTPALREMPIDIKPVQTIAISRPRKTAETAISLEPIKGMTEAFDRDDFHKFFVAFDSKRNLGSPFEKAPADEAQKRFETAGEAFASLQTAITKFSKFSKDRIEQALGRKPDAADILSINTALEQIAAQNPQKIEDMIRKIEFLPKIEENLARLENDPILHKAKPLLETVQEDLIHQRKTLAETYDGMLKSFDESQNTTLELQKAVAGNTFLSRIGSLLGVNKRRQKIQEELSTKYGVTIETAATRLGTETALVEAYRDELKRIVLEFAQLTARYDAIKGTLSDIQKAEEEKQKIEDQCEALKIELIRDSKIFQQVAGLTARKAGEQMMGLLASDAEPQAIAEAEKQFTDIERAGNNIDYTNSPELGKKLSKNEMAFVPGEKNIIEKLRKQLEKAIETPVKKAVTTYLSTTGSVSELEKILQKYTTTAREKRVTHDALVDVIAAYKKKDKKKAFVLHTIQLRLNT